MIHPSSYYRCSFKPQAFTAITIQEGKLSFQKLSPTQQSQYWVWYSYLADAGNTLQGSCLPLKLAYGLTPWNSMDLSPSSSALAVQALAHENTGFTCPHRWDEHSSVNWKEANAFVQCAILRWENTWIFSIRNCMPFSGIFSRDGVQKGSQEECLKIANVPQTV